MSIYAAQVLRPVCSFHVASVVKLPAESDSPAYDVVAILDPVSRAAQKYTPLIMVSDLRFFAFLAVEI